MPGRISKKPFQYICLIVSLLLISCSSNQMADYQDVTSGFPIILQGTSLMGHLVCETTQEPVPMAKMYVKGTSITSMTDTSGLFHLKNIPVGKRTLMIDVPGYFPVVMGLDVQSEIVIPFRIEIPEKSLVATDTCQTTEARVEMLEHQIIDLRYKLSKCSEEIALFEKYMVGHQSECKIINPEVIDYVCEENKHGFTIHYNLRHPLILENNYTGYRMTVFWEKAVFREYYYKYSIDYTASVNFESIESVDLKQVKYWNRMRRHVYEGSFRNFLVALVHNNLDQEGFVLYQPSQVNMEGRALLGYSNQQSAWSLVYEPQKLFSRAEKSQAYTLAFDGMIRVTYILKGLGDKSTSEWGLTGDGQSSTVQLVNGPIQFNQYGHTIGYIQPHFSGYWKTTQISELLPLDYNPN